MPITIMENHERLLQQAEAKLELQRRGIDRACKEWVISHKRGPMYWLRNLTKTENYHWQEMGLLPEMPFPYEPLTDYTVDLEALRREFPHEFTEDDPPDYLDVIMGYLLQKKQQLYIPKTREMMTSWLVVGFITWYCQFREKTQALSQSESDIKAMGLIEYANILYRNQPEWLRRMYPLTTGTVEGSSHEIEWAHSSKFSALPSGIRKLASAHPTVYFMDEAAHIPGAEATINIAAPAVPQIIAVSSVAPGFFADTCGC